MKKRNSRPAVVAVPPEANPAKPAEQVPTALALAGQRLEVQDIPACHSGATATLVLLHDGIGSLALWRGFPSKLAALTGLRTVTYSRAGHGASSPVVTPRDVDYMHREALEVLPQLLEALAIERPVLFGHSDGASIALIYAGSTPSPLCGLILEAPHVFVEDITIAGIRAAKRQFETSDLASRLARYHDSPAMTFRLWNDIWLSPGFRDWNIESCLPPVTAPILLIQGEDDDYGTTAQLDAIAQKVCGTCERLLLPHCGHSPHRDQEEAVLATTAGFLRRHGLAPISAPR